MSCSVSLNQNNQLAKQKEWHSSWHATFSQFSWWTVGSVGTLWTQHLSHYNGRHSFSPIMLCYWAALGNVWNEQPATISSVSIQLNRKLMNHSKQLVGCSKREQLHQKSFIGDLSMLKWINYILRLVGNRHNPLTCIQVKVSEMAVMH